MNHGGKALLHPWLHSTHLAILLPDLNRHRGESRLSSPATPPDMRVRIRRFDRLVPPRMQVGWAFAVWGRRVGFTSHVSILAGFTRFCLRRPAKAGWIVQCPPRDPSPTDPSYRSGLPHSREYYALG